ncbi:MAG TPA: CPBP family intramembrane glutamic endopeptidase [Patescibacteria group bacterium]|nr:CPBP family intramembrane glutamic endopeptidase [Patescibacteria group bacterium]
MPPAGQFIISLVHEPTHRERWAAIIDEFKQHSFTVKTFLFIAGVIGVSQLLLLVAPVAGVFANVVALALLAAFAIRSDRTRTMAIAASILPLATMVSLALPQSNALDQSAVLYSVLFVLAFAYHYIFPYDKSAGKLTWKGYLAIAPTMIVAGQVLGALSYGVLRNEQSFGGISLPVVTIAMILFALTEEIFFRGLIQEQASKAINPIVAPVLTATLYTLMTLPIGSIATTLFAASSSIILSCIYYTKPNIVITTIANMTLKVFFVGLLAAF